MAYAELHCHSHFSFLDGASSPGELIERAVDLGLNGIAITDHQGLYGVVRFANAAREAGLRPIVGIEVELVDALSRTPAPSWFPPAARRRPAAGRSLTNRMSVPSSGGPFGRAFAMPLDRPRPRTSRGRRRDVRFGRVRFGPGCPGIERT